MSINLTRRDALRGAIAAGAALAAAPYLLNLNGGLQAAQPESTPARPATVAGTVAAQNASPSNQGDSGSTTVLVISGDTVKSYSGFQTVKVQDAVLASRLRNAVAARFE